MTKKQRPKRAFDWRTHSRPARLLTPAQEAAFAGGFLAPVLAWATVDPRTRFEVRARSAALYHRGVSLCRVGGDAPFEAELESTDATPSYQVSLMNDEAVVDLVRRLDELRGKVDDLLDSGEQSRNHRSYSAALATGNAGGDLTRDALVAVDLEYALGRRRFDLVALMRSDGVTGPGGFASPDLAFVDVRVPGQTLRGAAGLSALADDLADFAKALCGEHVRRSCTEVQGLLAQKIRLGLLPEELGVRSIAGGMPHLVVVFAEREVDGPGDDEAIVELHDRLASRHYPTMRLHFAHVVLASEDGEGLAVSQSDLMDYRSFKAYRRARSR